MGSNREQEFVENSVQLSGANYQKVAPSFDLNGQFSYTADQETHDKMQATYRQAEQATVLEQGRMLRMGNLELSQISSNGAFAFAAQKRAQMLKQEQSKKAHNDAVMLALLDSIDAFEEGLAKTHGEHFATDLMEELYLEGKITDEERDRINAITDINEQRQAVAELLMEKLRNGEITRDDLKDHPFALEWIDKYEAVEERALEEKAEYDAGGATYEDLSTKAQDKVMVEHIANGGDPKELSAEPVTTEDELVIKDENVIEEAFDF